MLTQHWQNRSVGLQKGSDQSGTGAATAAGNADEAISTAVDAVGDPLHLNVDQVLVPGWPGQLMLLRMPRE